MAAHSQPALAEDSGSIVCWGRIRFLFTLFSEAFFCFRLLLSPSKDTLLATLLSLAAIAMLYCLSRANSMGFPGFALKYGREMSNFNSIEGVFHSAYFFRTS